MMDRREEESAEKSRIDKEAAEWAARQVRGLNAQEQDEFFDWLAADPRHSEWHEAHMKTWRRLDKLVEWRPEHSLQPNADLLRPTVKKYEAWKILLMSAAVLAFALISFSWVSEKSQIGTGKWTYASDAIYSSHVLADESEIELNTGAEVAVEYTPQERRVVLKKSEAYFEVAKDTRRPFIVQAGGVEVLATGTAFSVEVSDNRVSVLVTEGTVEITSKQAAQNPLTLAAKKLVAGQRSIIHNSSDLSEISIVNSSFSEVNQLLDWKPKVLEFDNAPLGQIIDAFNERSDTQIVLNDRELNDIPLAVSFRIINAQHLTEILEATLSIRSETSNDGDQITLYRN